MKSLGKALEVLEYVVCQEGTAVTPSEAAAACGINVSSCVRTIKLLVERGYLEQVSRRSGYVTGPAAVALGDRRSVYGRLAAAAAEPLAVLAQRINGLVNLSVYHRGQRYIIKHLGNEARVRLAPQLRYDDDYYDSATGRLLLSTMNSEEVDALVKNVGLPSGQRNRKELEQTLAEYRRQGWVKFWSERQQLWIVGSLVTVPGLPVAATGFGVADEKTAEQAVVWTVEATNAIAARLREVKMCSY